MREATDDQNNITVTKIARVADVSQDWRAYNATQNSGIKLFGALLKDLETWKNSHKRWGKPRLHPVKESVFCSIQKVYFN